MALLPRYLESAFRSEWTSRLRFRTEVPTKLIESLQTGEIDIAIAPAELYFSDEALAQKLAFSDTVSVYAGRGHPLARTGTAKIAELGDYDWLGIGTLSRFRGTTGELLETIGAPNIRTKIEFSGNVSTPIELLRSGKWLGLIPDFLKPFLPGAEALVRISLGKALPTRDVLVSPRRRGPPAIDPVLRFVFRVSGQIEPEHGSRITRKTGARRCFADSRLPLSDQHT